MIASLTSLHAWRMHDAQIEALCFCSCAWCIVISPASVQLQGRSGDDRFRLGDRDLVLERFPWCQGSITAWRPFGLHNYFPLIFSVKRGVRWKWHFSQNYSSRFCCEMRKELCNATCAIHAQLHVEKLPSLLMMDDWARAVVDGSGHWPSNYEWLPYWWLSLPSGYCSRLLFDC